MASSLGTLSGADLDAVNSPGLFAGLGGCIVS